jgi:TP901 family phage tail tape measure protein
MAERTVTVRLRAAVDDYKRAMASAGKATQDVARSADNWKRLGQSTAAIGDTLSRNLTLPIVAVGAAAVKMALDFDSAFAQMRQLAGVSASEIDGLKESVLGLAGETGKAPQELAEALYFIRSSGLDGAAALDALEMSAKASAAGMGSTVEIADAVTSAMNAYAESNLTAAEATDVLIATAAEGKAEPAELAAQMGKLLPLASELGISFQDVGASIATLSLKGNDAAASSTLLQNVMQKLLRPSRQASEALAAVGISTDDIRTMIAERGLLGTLETLKASLGDSGFTRFWEDAQAVQGALGLVGGDIDATRDRFETLNNSAGETDKAFAKWADTMGAQNAQAFAQLQVALIRIGDVIAPIAADVISFAAKFLEAFSKLPKPVQNTVLALAGIAAALGPFMSVGGRLVSVAASLYSTLVKLALPAGTVSGAFNNAGASAGSFGSRLSGLQRTAALAAGAAGIAGLVLAVKTMGDANKSAQIDDIAQQLAGIGDTSDQGAIGVIRLTREIGNNAAGAEKLNQLWERTLGLGTEQAARFIEMAEAAGVSEDEIAGMRDELERKREADVQGAADAETNTAAVREGAAAFNEEEAAITAATDALQGHADALAAQFDPLFGMIQANQGVRDARLAVTEATHNLAVAEAEHGANSTEAATASRELRDAQYGAGQAALAQEQAMVTLAQAVTSGDVSIEEARSGLQRWIESAGLTEAEALILEGKFNELIGAAENYAGDYSASVSADISPAQAALNTAVAEMLGWDGTTGTAEAFLANHASTPLGAIQLALGGWDASSGTADANVADHASSPMGRIAALLSGWDASRGDATSGLDTGLANAGFRHNQSNMADWNTSFGRGTAGLNDNASGPLGRIESLLNSYDGRSVTATINVVRREIGGPAGSLIEQQLKRAHGGPVASGRLYEVAEQGKAELLEMAGRTYLIPGGDGTVIPAGDGNLLPAGQFDTLASMRPAAGSGDGVYAPTYQISMAGAVVGSEAEAAKWVAKAIRRAGENGIPVTMRGRSL